MKEFKIKHLDVFTRTPFTGNPLLVVLGAEGLGDSEMQAIASEFSMPETTFVLPPDNPDVYYKVRIFTPIKEIPFAGHPIVGTAHVVVTEGIVEVEKPRGTFTHETGIGILPIEVIYDGAEVPRIVMTQGKPEFLIVPDEKQISSVAKALRVSERDMMETGLTPQVVSTGLPQLFVPLKSLETISNLSPDLGKVKMVEESLGLEGVGVFTLETVNKDASIHLRFFAPSIGIDEDAAAGSAAGGLGAYLARWNVLPEEELRDFSVEQGLEMGRPSRLHVNVEVQDGRPVKVKVGGYSVTILSGTLKLP